MNVFVPEGPKKYPREKDKDIGPLGHMSDCQQPAKLNGHEAGCLLRVWNPKSTKLAQEPRATHFLKSPFPPPAENGAFHNCFTASVRTLCKTSL